LTGIGPWTVTWNDTTIQTVPIAGSGPATLTRTVTPGPFDSNHASNHVYFVTGVSNADTCIANQPGDIQGNVSILINPRPTATLGSYSATNCDIGASYAFTNTLTGI